MSFMASPTTATITITGGTSSITQPFIVSPTTATATLTGDTSTFVANYSGAPATATAAITGGTPVVSQGKMLSPTTATVTITGATPALVFGSVFYPTHATVSIGGDTSYIPVGIPSYTAHPTTASIVINPGTPILRAGGVGFFLISGWFLDVENPPLTGSQTKPVVNSINGFVTFYPRLPMGSVLFFSNLPGDTTTPTALALAPIQAQILNGQLQTIDSSEAPNIQLLANTQLISSALIAQGLSPTGTLYYDVRFSGITYSNMHQQINNFAILAPTVPNLISLTDPSLPRYAYAGPN